MRSIRKGAGRAIDGRHRKDERRVRAVVKLMALMVGPGRLRYEADEDELQGRPCGAEPFPCGEKTKKTSAVRRMRGPLNRGDSSRRNLDQDEIEAHRTVAEHQTSLGPNLRPFVARAGSRDGTGGLELGSAAGPPAPRITGLDHGADPAAGIELSGHRSADGTAGRDHVVEDAVDDILIEDAEVPVGEDVILERLELEAGAPDVTEELAESGSPSWADRVVLGDLYLIVVGVG
jgi:hypothetical protein